MLRGAATEKKKNHSLDRKSYQLLIIVVVDIPCFQCKRDISNASYISEGDKICGLTMSSVLYRGLYESFLKTSLECLCSALPLILDENC